ncbi:MAG: Gfo/Idh/MocA family oxidoreductase [Granulosicoccus sp.]|nr:Gfo/Idh/MocA family oxidoreductase [Granulosicoccus sp.]
MHRKPLALLLIGAGRMAHTHAERFSQLDNVSILAGVDTDHKRVNEFCRSHNIPYAYETLDDALSEHHYDAVSVVTPDAFHAPVTVTALANKLPVLCEKPLADSLAAADTMCAVAKESGLLNMVNLSYRVSGALNRAYLLIDEGAVGTVRHVEASYRQSWLCSDYWGNWQEEDAWLWRLSTTHGSQGVLGDIGIHILDFLATATGLDVAALHCRLKTFDKAPGNQIGQYLLDANDSCVINVELTNGALGVVHMSRYYTGYQNDLELSIHGTAGALQLSTGQNGDRLRVCAGADMNTQRWQLVDCDQQADTFERFVTCLRDGSTASPDFAHARKLQAWLERCFESHNGGHWLTV